MPETAVVRVLIADDHPIYRIGLRRLLEADQGFAVLAEATDGREAIDLTRAHRPDVLLLDVAMPTVSGLDALLALGNECSRTRIVLLTAAIEPQDALRALRLGASGVLLKTSAADQIFKCIRTVVAGHYWIGGDAFQSLVESLAKGPSAVATDTAPRLFGLTTRELEVITLVSTGASNRDIARQLGLSEETVKHHLSKIFDKTGQSTRVELALFATHAGLVPRG
jgi:two-component system, NarL family, nitrate/nitrite response regulator NarL